MSNDNLNEKQKSYLRGKRYNLEKRQDGGHGDQKSVPQSAGPIAEKLAEEYQVSSATIERDGEFADTVETLEEQVREDIRETVMRRSRWRG